MRYFVMLLTRRYGRSRYILGVVLGILLAGGVSGHAQQSGFDVWTNIDGREMTAKLLGSGETEAEFLLRSGERAHVKLQHLVEDDRRRIEDFRQRDTFWKEPPLHAQWPDRVSVNWIQEEVEVVEEGKNGLYTYRTRHFEFEADAKLSPNLVRDFSRIFEVTHAALKENPLGLRLYRPEGGYFKVRLFKNTMGYHRAGGLLNAAGVYNGTTKQILVPFRSLGLREKNMSWVRQGQLYDPTVLVHEVTHQLLDHWLEAAPIWFNEGFADLVGAARYHSGQLLFRGLEKGIKERILVKGEPNDRIHDRGPGGFEVSLVPQAVLHASQAEFMGFPPAPTLEHRDVLHHYHTSLLLVYFAINDGEHGAEGLRRYLEMYRKTVITLGMQDLEFPDEIASKEDVKEFQKQMKKKIAIQNKAMSAAYRYLARDRSEKDFFADMTRFYKALGIHLRPGE